MLPEDADWYANDGNEPITHDWVNSVERSVDAIKASGSDATFPAPTGTTLAWGGGRILVCHNQTGIAAGATWVIDNTVDHRNRVLALLGGGYCNSATRLPGEASYSGAGAIGFDVSFAPTDNVFYTEAGATDGDPPGGGANYWELIAGEAYIFADTGNGNALTFRNGNGVATNMRVFMVLWVSDQYPARLP